MVGSGSIGEVFNSVAHSEMLKTSYLGFTPVDFLPKISWLWFVQLVINFQIILSLVKQAARYHVAEPN